MTAEKLTEMRYLFDSAKSTMNSSSNPEIRFHVSLADLRNFIENGRFSLTYRDFDQFFKGFNQEFINELEFAQIVSQYEDDLL